MNANNFTGDIGTKGSFFFFSFCIKIRRQRHKKESTGKYAVEHEN